MKKRPLRSGSRCAWCGRYAVGERFLPRDETPRFVSLTPSSRITHGICPDCNVAMADNGACSPGCCDGRDLVTMQGIRDEARRLEILRSVGLA